MIPVSERDGLSGWLRWTLLLLASVMPLAFGAGSPGLYLPAFTIVYLLSAASWVRARFDRSLGRGAPPVPGARLLWAIVALATLQLVPLPPALLGVISPASWAFHHLGKEELLWEPLSLSPGATGRGLFCVGAVMALYAFACREYRSEAWRRRALATLAVAAAALGTVGLVQAASEAPSRIYGVIDVDFQRAWAIWGPYMNRNHFAGYVAMMVPLGVGLAVAGTAEFRHLRRRFGFGRALGDASFPRALQWSAFALYLAVASQAPQTRGGLLCLGAGLAALLLLAGHARVVLTASALLGLGALSLLDFSNVSSAFEGRGMNRLGIWKAMLPMLQDFPVFGTGLNTFLVAFRPYQVDFRSYWVTAAHNDYLQVVADLGLLGAALAVPLGLGLVRAMLAARGDALLAAAAAGVAGAAAHAVFDYALQVPANAAAFAILCGVLAGGVGLQRRQP